MECQYNCFQCILAPFRVAIDALAVNSAPFSGSFSWPTNNTLSAAISVCSGWHIWKNCKHLVSKFRINNDAERAEEPMQMEMRWKAAEWDFGPKLRQIRSARKVLQLGQPLIRYSKSRDSSLNVLRTRSQCKSTKFS